MCVLSASFVLISSVVLLPISFRIFLVMSFASAPGGFSTAVSKGQLPSADSVCCFLGKISNTVS